jgi:hypothetical protein
LVQAVQDGGLRAEADARALARFVMVFSEGFAVHAAAGAERDDLHASIGIALRAVTAFCN